MGFDFNNESFKNFLREKENQIHLRTSSNLQENENFKKLLNLLVTYRSEKPITSITAIMFNHSEIENLCSDPKNLLFNTLDSHQALTNNHLLLDRNLVILSSERKVLISNSSARDFYSEVSQDVCVFLLSREDVTYFIDGKPIGDAIFFTLDALTSYNELKDISRLFEIFEEYKIHLRERDAYSKFFVSKTGKKSLHKHLEINGKTKLSENGFLNSCKQLLRNKPEDSFREDLRYFLRQKLKAKLLGKEYILDNFRRLDIFILDELGELYLIEVKWVGISIHSSGQKIGTEFKAADINPDAIKQSVDYIKELYQKNQVIKIAYLVVFDARESNLPDTGLNFDENEISADDKKFYSRFKKVDDFRVINYVPA